MPGAEGSQHHLPIPDVLALTDSDPDRGLSAQVAAERLADEGPNALPPPHTRSALARWLSQFRNPLIYVLLAAVVLTAALGEVVDASVILGVVIINAVVGYLQESRADAALRALAELDRGTARVVRDAAVQQIDAEQLVAGDLIILEAGDRVPADARLIEVHELTVDESMLTGESVPVGKHALTIPYETALADRANMAYSSTLVIRGQARAVVVATGDQTEIGRITRLVEQAEGVQTPLTRKLTAFSRWLTLAIVVLAAGTFAVGIARGQTWAEMITASVALAVGAIPEGLPAAVTITLAIGVSRMARRNAIIRHLPAVEALGSATIICTDKTGTLTRNRMRVVALDIDGEATEPPELEPRDGPLSDNPAVACLIAATLCNNADLSEIDGEVRLAGDPTETALLEAAHERGGNLQALEARWPRLDEVPFETELGYMATLHEAPDEPVLLVKGAPERVLAMCADVLLPDGTLAPVSEEELLDRVGELAGQALRVLAVARGRDGDLESGRLSLLGMACMIDPARPEAATSVAACREAGIAVKMITGDHPLTGRAIGAQVGLAGPDRVPQVVTGVALTDTADSALPELIEGTGVFARVTAEQKLRIVRAAQQQGHVVAMTGDGVNDAPALRQADIGVAMGVGGSEVAKDAADMVLSDDNFSSIEAAVEEGRGVYDNLSKFIAWTLPTNLGEGLLITFAIAIGAALPITPLQVLWINMTTAVALGLMLAFEPREADIMRRPPRPPDSPILTRVLIMRIVLVGAIMLAAAFTMFEVVLRSGAPIEVARTVAVNTFVAIEIGYLFNCRTLTRPAGSVGWFSNRWLLLGVAVTIVGQLALTYLPIMNTLFGTAGIDLKQWAAIIMLAVVAFWIIEAEKAIRARRSGPPPLPGRARDRLR